MAFKETLMNSGAVTLIIRLIFGFIILALISYFAWKWFQKKYMYSYKFIRVLPNGRAVFDTARIILNKQKIKKFELRSFKGQLLDIHDPNFFISGQQYRVVAGDGKGNLIWCDTIKVNREKYMETSLLPIERQSMADTVIEATTMHGKIHGSVKLAMGLGIVMVIVLLFGLYANGQMALEANKQTAAGLANAKKLGEINHDTVKVISENTKVMKTIFGYMSKDKFNLTFTAD